MTITIVDTTIRCAGFIPAQSDGIDASDIELTQLSPPLRDAVYKWIVSKLDEVTGKATKMRCNRGTNTIEVFLRIPVRRHLNGELEYRFIKDVPLIKLNAKEIGAIIDEVFSK